MELVANNGTVALKVNSLVNFEACNREGSLETSPVMRSMASSGCTEDRGRIVRCGMEGTMVTVASSFTSSVRHDFTRGTAVR